MRYLAKAWVVRQFPRPCRSSRLKTSSVALAILFSISVRAQVSGSIEGRLSDEYGTAVAGLVTATSGRIVSRAATKMDGTFTLNGLSSGSYSLCAQVPLVFTKNNDHLFADSCMWPDLSAPSVKLGFGERHTGTVITVKRGYPVAVRVNDPLKLLGPAKNSYGDNTLLIYMIGPTGLARHVPITAQDQNGRSQLIVIPYDTKCRLSVQSTTLKLEDEHGQLYSGNPATQITASLGQAPVTYVVNVAGKVQP